jgi:hypothetical protein
MIGLDCSGFEEGDDGAERVTNFGGLQRRRRRLGRRQGRWLKSETVLVRVETGSKIDD